MAAACGAGAHSDARVLRAMVEESWQDGRAFHGGTPGPVLPCTGGESRVRRVTWPGSATSAGIRCRGQEDGAGRLLL